ncbi:MAG: hypothetical protein HYS22_04470 [Deltaproteobacteria bacterium]|nr:hypothetical protein [Deltaproteobacteria bacterium]
MDTLLRLQQTLEKVYSLPHIVDISRFLTHSEAVRGQVKTEEVLFIYQRSENLELALFIDQRVLANLEKNDPWKEVHSRNFSDFCTAAEGVSHFVFLMQRVSEQRPVRPLELELQGEIDKFVLSSLFLQGQEKQQEARDLPESLFENYSLLPHLSAEEKERYETANRLARRYSALLIKRHPSSLYDLLLEVRQFYPLPLSEKIHTIQNHR